MLRFTYKSRAFLLVYLVQHLSWESHASSRKGVDTGPGLLQRHLLFISILHSFFQIKRNRASNPPDLYSMYVQYI